MTAKKKLLRRERQNGRPVFYLPDVDVRFKPPRDYYGDRLYLVPKTMESVARLTVEQGTNTLRDIDIQHVHRRMDVVQIGGRKFRRGDTLPQALVAELMPAQAA